MVCHSLNCTHKFFVFSTCVAKTEIAGSCYSKRIETWSEKMMHDGKCLEDLRKTSQLNSSRSFTSGVYCTLECPWMWFRAFCAKYSHSNYKTCLFLLDNRT